MESQIVSKAKAENYLKKEVKAVELECFPKTKVESQIASKAMAKNYLKEEIELEGQIDAEIKPVKSQIVDEAKAENHLIKEEICSKATSVGDKRQLNPLNFKSKQLPF